MFTNVKVTNILSLGIFFFFLKALLHSDIIRYDETDKGKWKKN